MENGKQVWFKPSQIVKDGLITAPGSSNYHTNYRYVLRLIKSGELASKVWTAKGIKSNSPEHQTSYYMVHIDEINRYNSQVEA